MLVTVIKKVCEKIGLVYKNIDEDGVFIRIDLGNGKFHLVIADNFGLNDEVVEKICRDKVYTHALLNSYVKMPKSLSFVDLYTNKHKISEDKVAQRQAYEQIAQTIIDHNLLPAILKPNSKSGGINVFQCNNQDEIVTAVESIFNKNSSKYDHVLLAQEQIKIKREFRVIVYKGEIQFVYQKDNTGFDAKFVGNLSPLHYENAKAVLVDEEKEKDLLSQLKIFINPIFSKLNVQYAGLDVALDESGHLYLFELNSRPSFDYFIRDNGAQKIMQFVEKVLMDLIAE